MHRSAKPTSANQRGINIVDLMMWLVIAALLLATAIQSIAYYQKSAYMYTMQSDVSGAATNVMAQAGQGNGEVDLAAAKAGLAETKWSQNVISTVGTTSADKPFIRVSHPGVPEADTIYLFDNCGDLNAGVNVVPKSGSVSCGIGTSDVQGWESVALDMNKAMDAKRNWYRVASSPDGTNLLAADDGGYLSTSIDGGATWKELNTAGARWWMSASMSPDGKNIVAGEDGGRLHSSKDAGLTWKTHDTIEAANSKWNAVAFSADGSRVVAATLGATGALDGVPYTSTNGGETWTRMTGLGIGRFASLAISANGSKIVAAKQDDYIHTSTDGGATWTAQVGSGKRHWMDVASSADGTKLLALTAIGYIYTSTDSGVTWTERNNVPSSLWLAAGVSGDGSKMVAGVDGGYIWASSDLGATWNKQAIPGSANWDDIAITHDGTKVIASQWNGYIFTGTLK